MILLWVGCGRRRQLHHKGAGASTTGFGAGDAVTPTPQHLPARRRSWNLHLCTTNVHVCKNKANELLVRRIFVMCGLSLCKLCGKDISKLEVAFFCFLGHRSNPNLMGWSPENLDFHDFWIFGTRRIPYLWIWIHQITLTNLRTIPTAFSNRDVSMQFGICLCFGT